MNTARIQKLMEMQVSNPKDCFLGHALGLEYLKANDLEKAIMYFKNVLDIDYKYVGTYYHLAKALELQMNKDEAVLVYEKGIQIAQELKDNHARNELQMALDDLID